MKLSTLLLLVSNVGTAVVADQQLDCNLYSTFTLNRPFGDIQFREVVNPVDQTVTLEMTYAGTAWLGIAVNSNGLMIPNTAVIGMPDMPLGLSNPGLYRMTQRNPNFITPLEDAQQTLTDTALTQNGTHTVLRFTQMLSNPEQMDILAEGTNTAIFAVGFNNFFGFHGDFGNFPLELTPCLVLDSVASGMVMDGDMMADAFMNMTNITDDELMMMEEEEEDMMDEEEATGMMDGDTMDGNEQTMGGETAEDLMETVIIGNLDCTLRRTFSVSDGLLTFREVVNPVNATVTVEITYAAIGWIGMAVNSNGFMIPNTAVIGMPDRPVSRTNPGKYFMDRRLPSGINLLEDDQQTLMDTSLTQNGTHTVMRFTQRLSEEGQMEILAEGNNTAIYAVGASNTFGFHIEAANFRLELTPCVLVGEEPVDNPNTGEVQIGNEVSLGNDDMKWLIHGYLMALGWGLFVPLAIGSSVLRSLIPGPPGTWFTLHKSFNALGLACTIAGYAIARSIGAGGESSHTHVGRIIFILSLVQAAIALVRPDAPHPKEPEKEQDTQQDPEPATAAETQEVPAKTGLRAAWEYQHRITGLLLLGGAWYNVIRGIILYDELFGDVHGVQIVFPVVAGGVLFSVLVLKITTLNSS